MMCADRIVKCCKGADVVWLLKKHCSHVKASAWKLPNPFQSQLVGFGGLSVLGILRSGGNPEIFQSIVQRVSICVIHNISQLGPKYQPVECCPAIGKASVTPMIVEFYIWKLSE